MENGDTEKYRARSVIQDFVFLGCIRCISLQVYNKRVSENYIDPKSLFVGKTGHRQLFLFLDAGMVRTGITRNCP